MKLTSDKSWPDLCRERYRWAEQSYSAILQRVDAGRLIQTDENASHQVSVIVYGPAQVGKTSFILTLLGVRDEHFNLLNSLLRGDQLLGTMSTARSYRYRIAADDSWYFSHIREGKQPLGNEQARTEFTRLRQKVEQGCSVFDSIDVFIPRYFFNLENQINHRLLIRDLPGTHSTSKNEQEYVNDLASRYLSSADVVLLTGRVDALYFLKPEELGNALLNDWHWQPHRYRIILTRSYSDATLCHRLKNTQPRKVALQQYLLGQINTLELSLPDSISQLIYPVECGHSWQAIITEKDDYAQQCLRLRQEILADLQTSLQQSSHPLSRLRTGYALPQMIQQRITAENEAYIAEKSRIDNALAYLVNPIKKYQKREKKNKYDLERLQQQLTAMQDQSAVGREYDFHTEIGRRLPSQPLTETTKYLKDAITDYKLHCISVWRDWCAENAIPVTSPPPFNRINGVENHLDSYLFKKYFRSDNFMKDKASMHSACRTTSETLNQRAAGLQAEKIKRNVDALLRQQRRYLRQSRRIALILSILERKKITAECQKSVLTQHHEEQIARFKTHYSDSKKFREVILEAKQHRASEIKHHMMKPQITHSERLAWLLMYKALRNDFEFVKSLDEETRDVE